MGSFAKTTELRRNIFGLGGILKAQQQPELVQQKLPQIMEQVANLALKMHAKRVAALKEDKEHLERGGKDEDSDEEEGADDLELDDDVGADPLAEKVASKLNTGKKLTQEEMDRLAFDDEGDDSDSDMDLPGAEMKYGSALEAVDELLFLRQCITEVHAANS